MAEVTTITNQFKYDFEFTNASGSSATRSFTIDTRNFEGGLSAAQELQNFFAGTGSLSVAAITPNEFIQPTGWRDNNPAEPPWTTNMVYLTGITKYETTYNPAGGGGGGGMARNFIYEVSGSYLNFGFDGANEVQPKVYDSNGNSVTVQDIADENYAYSITISAGNTYFIFKAANDGYAPLAETVTV